MRFETKEDLLRERAIIDKIDSNAVKLGDNDLDFLIPKKAYVEIKTANCSSSTPKEYLISLQKVLKMQYANKTLPTYLFIQFKDKLKYIYFGDITGEVKENGRKKRNGSTNDIELMIHVNPAKFKTWDD